MAVTHLDVLDQFEKIPVCIGYQRGTETVQVLPNSLSVLEECEPIYEELPGWQEDTSQARSLSDLPDAARKYLKRLEGLMGKKISMVTVGSDRDQIILIEPIA